MNFASSLRKSEVPRPCSLSSRAFSSDMSPMGCLRLLRCEERSGGDCLRGRQLAGGGLHGLDDVLVAGAAAQVAGDAVADLLLGRVRVLLQQAIGARQH